MPQPAYQQFGGEHLLNNEQQTRLSNELSDWLEQTCHEEGCSPLAMLFFLLSYVWGWAWRCGWKTPELASYSLRAWEACDRAKRGETNIRA